MIIKLFPDNSACCQWIGPGSSGHFVKMIHNGIEYGDMQLISEIYQILKSTGYNNSELSELFNKWNHGKLNSFLIQISSDIFVKKNEIVSGYVLDSILDTAGQKGTGKWSVAAALDLGQIMGVTSAAVFQRFLSSERSTRISLSYEIDKSIINYNNGLEEKLENALYLSRLISYLQGFTTLTAASNEYEWNLNLAEIALIWTNGCIIRSNLLKDIMQMFRGLNETPSLFALFNSKFVQTVIEQYESDLREIVLLCLTNKISVPGLSSVITYLDGIRTKQLPANLIQAQRDYFGAHSFKLLDTENVYSINWED